MNCYHYKLEPYTQTSKSTCPACGVKKCFTRYVKIDTGERLSNDVGICDRQIKCGYHKTPAQYFKETGNNRFIGKREESNFVLSIPRPIQYLPKDIADSSLSHWDKNNFTQWLIAIFGNNATKTICEKFLVGSAKHWQGSTAFWQVDINGNFRQLKIILYDIDTGKRVKKGFFVHKWNQIQNEHIKTISETDCAKVYGKYLNKHCYNLNLSQCFYGENQLKENLNKKIGIVESEKTAIILSFYYPEYIWLATGGLQGCRWTDIGVCKVLKGREVVLFPDMGKICYQLWKSKAIEISNKINCKIYVSDFLEIIGTMAGLKQGEDIADYLLKNHTPHIIFSTS